jgi:hypothetical protein
LALRTSIRRRTGVDIAAIDALAAAPECYQPALFVHARDDELIYPSHSQALAAAWAGDSRVLLVGERQGHNTLRPRHIVASCVHFLCNVLGGGLKDAEALFMNVGDGRPPPAAPHATDPQGVRAALLQRMWLRMAEKEQEGGSDEEEDEEGYEAECGDEEEDDGSGGAWHNEAAAQRAQIPGSEESRGDEDDDDDWEKEGAVASALAGTASLRASEAKVE